jgi:hypothetical protein
VTQGLGAATARSETLELIAANLQSIDGRVAEIQANVRVMAVKLFGTSDPDAENDTGRLPKAEGALQAHDKRITSLERKMAWYAGAAAVVATICMKVLDKIPFATLAQAGQAMFGGR